MEEELKEMLKKYLGEKETLFFEEKEKILETLRDFYFWLEGYGEGGLLTYNPASDSNIILAQRIAFELVMMVSLIHKIKNQDNGGAVFDFFKKNLNLKEKLLFLNLFFIYDKPPEDYKPEFFEKRKKDREKEINKLLNYYKENDDYRINKELEEKIKYLFGIRSQIVHKGIKTLPFKIKFMGNAFLKGAIVYVEEYKPKNIENKAIYFENPTESGNPCYYLLRTLFLSALCREIYKDFPTSTIVDYEVAKIEEHNTQINENLCPPNEKK